MLSLTWDAYQKNICNGLGLLQQRGEFVDMTIAADGHQVKVHKMIMSLVSPYIKELITSSQSPHPIIFLNRVSYQTLQSILEYAYTGEVLVSRENFGDFLEACNALHIKGLESDSLKTTSNGDLLHLIGARGIQEPDQPLELEMEKPIQTGIKRKHNVISEEENENPDEYTYIIDESQMDDSALEDTDEKIVSEDIQENLECDEKFLARNSIIQYSLSCQGSIQLVLNRYIYCMRHTRKNNERMWRCTDYNKSHCRAYTVTRGDAVLERGCAHNHPYHDRQILKRVRNGNMYTAYKAIETIASLSKKLEPTDTNINSDAIS